MIYDLSSINYLYVRLFVLVVFTVFYLRLDAQKERLNPFFSFPIYFLTILACWYPNLLQFERSDDESEWVLMANDILYDPAQWFRERMSFHFIRVFTFGPLSLMGLFAFPLKWVHARIFNILLWSLCAMMYKSTARDVFSKRVASLSVVIMVWWVGLLTYREFVGFNSEVPLLFLIFLFVRKFVDVEMSKVSRMRDLFLAALTLAIMPFAKEQSAYICMTLGLAFVFMLFRRNESSRILLFFFFGFIAIVLLLTPLLLIDGMDDLLKRFQFILAYSKYGLDSEPPGFQDRISKTLYSIFTRGRHDLLALFTTAFFSFASLMVLKFNFSTKPPLWKNSFFQIVLVLFFVTLFSVFSPATFFQHYLLLLIPALLFFNAYGIDFMLRIPSKAWSTVLFGAVLSIYAFFSSNRSYKTVYDEKGMFKYSLPFSEYMATHSTKGDRLIVWGWRYAYYVESGLLPATGCTNITGYNPKYRIADFAVAQITDAIDQKRPKFIVEYAKYDHYGYAISDFPELSSRLKRDYVLYREEEGQRLHIRK